MLFFFVVVFFCFHSQEACVQGNLIAICLEQLTDPYPPLRQWLAICLGRVWFNYEAARWCAVRDSAPDKLYCLLSDPLPEVRVEIMCTSRKCPYFSHKGFLVWTTPLPHHSRNSSFGSYFPFKSLAFWDWAHSPTIPLWVVMDIFWNWPVCIKI